MSSPNRRGGNALVEFAMGFSMLFACVAGVFQYGHTMYIYNSLEAAMTGVPPAITVKVNSLTVNAIFRKFTFTGKPNVTVSFSGEYFTSP